MAFTGLSSLIDQTPALDGVVQDRTGLPASPRKGELYFITDEKALLVCTETTPVVWEDAGASKGVVLVPDATARLALKEGKDIENGSIVIQQDTLNIWRFTDNTVTDTDPAVTLSLGANAPSSTNPLNAFDLTFNGLPATKDTYFDILFIVYDENTGDAEREHFQFQAITGDGIPEIIAAINFIAYPNFTVAASTVADTVTFTFSPGFKILEFYWEAWGDPDPTVPLGERNWHPLSNYVIEHNFAAIQQLETDGHVVEGMMAHALDTGSIYLYSFGAWKEVIRENRRPHILSGLRYDPENAAHDRLEWHDARTEMAVVETTADLNDRSLLPVSHLVAGKLVFVKSEGVLYEFNADPTTITNTQADWKLLASGVTYVSRTGNLPTRATTPLIDGQLYVARADFAGKELYRLASYDSSMPGIPAVAPIPARDVSPSVNPKPAIGSLAALNTFLQDPSLVEGDWASLSADITITGTSTSLNGRTLPDTSTVMWVDGDLVAVEPSLVGGITTVSAGPLAPPTYGAVATFAGVTNLDYFLTTNSPPNPGEYYVNTGGTYTFPAADPQYAHVGNLAGQSIGFGDFLVYAGADTWHVITAGSADHTTIINGNTVTIAGTPTPPSLPPVDVHLPAVAGRPAIPGGWRFLNRRVWSKNLRSGTDQGTDQKDGDWLVTRESQHEEIKLWNAQSNQWDTIYSRDEINNAIAAMSLFEGTVTNSGHPTPGAVEFQDLPNLRHMSAQGDLSKVSHYFTYVGSPGYTVASSAAEKAAAIAGGGTWNDISVVGGQINHPTAGQILAITFLVGGQPNVQVGTERWMTVEFDATTLSGQERDFVTVKLDATDTPNDIATKLNAAWVDGTLGMDSSVNGNAWRLTPRNPTIRVTNSVIHDGGTPIIGEDLTGAVLNPGDWVMVSNAGGIGTGTGANAAAPDLRWVTIGGDLLAKSRANRLFGFQPWAAGGWEQGSLVIFSGDVFRATRSVTASDPAPVPAPITATLATVASTASHALTTAATGPLDSTGLTAGDWYEAAASGTLTGTTEAFAGDSYVAGDRYLWTGDASIAGATSDGFAAQQGFVKYPASAVAQFPSAGDTISVTNTSATPWAKLNISGGLKVATDDSQLPSVAPPGQVWIVLSSAQAGGSQALYAYDQGAATWQPLGGGGQPLDLTGGLIVYPRVIYHNGEAPLNLADASVEQPRIIGDLLVTRNQNGDPLLEATCLDGSTWRMLHPQRLTFDANGASKVARADHPLQLNVGIAGGHAKITHIADRSRNWIPVAEPVIPTVPTIAYKSASRATTSEAARIPGLLTGMARVLQPSKLWIGFYGSQDNGQLYQMTYSKLLQVENGLYTQKQQNLQATVTNDVAWFDVTWDDTNNRVYGSNISILDFRISTAPFNDLVAFQADFTYHRQLSFMPSTYRVFGYISIQTGVTMRTTLVQFGLDSGAGQVVTHSRLLNDW